LLEEPGRVRAMPFDRTGVWHRLDDLVFRRQTRCSSLRFAANIPVSFQPRAAGIIAMLRRPESGALTQWRLTTKFAIRSWLHRQVVTRFPGSANLGSDEPN